MKEWAYEALREAGAFNRLNEFAGRIIRGKKDFGTFLCEKQSVDEGVLSTCHCRQAFRRWTRHRYRSAYHYRVSGCPGDHRPQTARAGEIMVRPLRDSISGPDLILLLDYI